MADYPTPGITEFSAQDEQAMRRGEAERRGPAEAVNDVEHAVAAHKRSMSRGDVVRNLQALDREGRRRGGLHRDQE